MLITEGAVSGSLAYQIIDQDSFTESLAVDAVSLTFPRFQHLFSYPRSQEAPETWYVGALHSQGLIGVALAQRREPSVPEAVCLSVYVKAPFRRQGVAAMLLAALQERVAKDGIREISATFTSVLPSFEALSPLLKNCGWSAPVPRILFCRGSVEHVYKNAEWLSRIVTPESMSVFPWHELSDRERRQIEDDIVGGIVPIELSPFYEEKTLDSMTSVGLRVGSRVVGWQVNHPLEGEPDVMRYSRTYVYPEYQRTGRSLILIREAIVRNARPEVLERYPRFLSDVAYERREMVRFYQRHLIPLSEQHYSSFGSRKPLLQPSDV